MSRFHAVTLLLFFSLRSRRRPATVSFFRIRFSGAHCASERYLIIINYVAMGQPQPGALSAKGLNFLTIYKNGKMEIHKKTKRENANVLSNNSCMQPFLSTFISARNGFSLLLLLRSASIDGSTNRRFDGSTVRCEGKVFFLG